MTAATQVFSQGSYASRSSSTQQTLKTKLMVTLLASAVVASAFGLIYIRDVNRRLFIQQQNLQKAQNSLQIEWGKLLLEQGTWSSQSRIQHIAQQRLGMVYPAVKDVVLIRG